MMEGVVLERRQGRSMWRWILALEDILGMKGNEAGGLEFESFGQVREGSHVPQGTYCTRVV